MRTFSKMITGSIVALALAGTIAATPASAGYYDRSGTNAGAVAGAAIAGMAVGAMVGAAASRHRPSYNSYAYPPPPYGYGPRPYGYGGY